MLLTNNSNHRTLGTPLYIASIPIIESIFYTSLTLAILPISTYAIGIGIGALLATATSEIFGRTIVYKIATPLSLLFTVVGGASQGIGAVAATRMFAGLCAGPSLTVGVGILNDLWDISKFHLVPLQF